MRDAWVESFLIHPHIFNSVGRGAKSRTFFFLLIRQFKFDPTSNIQHPTRIYLLLGGVVMEHETGLPTLGHNANGKRINTHNETHPLLTYTKWGL
mmetsp:Transcript_28427/g.66000  ORF Transcript_28427/g.66000 Transcript_28427/m.66000 type:complete len:95 (-) Transcript_28427:97-381(-)